MGNAVQVREVLSRGERRAFVRLPWRLYRGDALWVPPLRSAVERGLDPTRNPFYQHAERRLYLAWRDGRPVGRIAAIVNRLHNELHQDRLGFWGYFESENDPEAARALLDCAAADLRQHGMTQMIGPMSPSINGECGILVEGFDRPPVILMPYNPSYYDSLVTQAGHQKAKDLLAFLVLPANVADDLESMQRLERLCAVVRRRHPTLRVRTLDMRNYEADVVMIGHLSNAARTNNWGFVPVTDDELRAMARDMRRVADPETVLIAEVEGKAVACMVNLPDVNPVLRKLNGRLLPFGWLRLLWGRRSVRGMRIFDTAVPEEYRRLGATPLLFLEMIRSGQRRGYTYAELSWVAENNLASIQTTESALHPRLYKRYRVYGREL
jgi:hypothetical protein